ncbi:hypothetical protein BZA05DRAFT_422941 [Tricharina praecox]|uniref:uncharacterized protein n=1 Tax=Tricharina praecox TaxID=43433 RepID=UPI00221FEDAF|nr:uncharacterized protein BZA05DRAFT_422941 [Tricharina praecox]KAI5841225.1 hypothetical protein BZA05DRAFT_422941 [Tricharina praecox]
MVENWLRFLGRVHVNPRVNKPSAPSSPVCKRAFDVVSYGTVRLRLQSEIIEEVVYDPAGLLDYDYGLPETYYGSVRFYDYGRLWRRCAAVVSTAGNGPNRIANKSVFEDLDNSDCEMRDGDDDGENSDSGDGASFVAPPLDCDDEDSDSDFYDEDKDDDKKADHKKADDKKGDDPKGGDDGGKSSSGDGAHAIPPPPAIPPPSCDDEDSDAEFYMEDEDVDKKDGEAGEPAAIRVLLEWREGGNDDDDDDDDDDEKDSHDDDQSGLSRSVSAAAVVGQQSSALLCPRATGPAKDTDADGMESLVALFANLSVSDERTDKDGMESLVTRFKKLSVSGKRAQDAVLAPAPPKDTDGVESLVGLFAHWSVSDGTTDKDGMESLVARFKKLSVSRKRRQDSVSAPSRRDEVDYVGQTASLLDSLQDLSTGFAARDLYSIRSQGSLPLYCIYS